ncbi:amino acid/amide ABC transporter substrate-binding protein (HAAT family) [Aminobacter aminovorans]|uniref:Leucine-, isoleucine-, valine-, threonine-, and alanine-binding protein n=1 Tax=Aminobacter aminovorans TaxID=83263 RepID=A0A381IJS2_AMIAI|nr:amino acid/amide ABC transporter substrate-binding protein (HAAT family) [Aminobacter aminovorans]SUY28117.1 Leucine-, isoleucine-, valine-, threonine-, and alanine-binding protein precursor [Aminobacter aminovorans]
MRLNRRHFLTTSAAGLGTLAMPGILRAQQGEAVRIGLITTLSGPGQLYGNYIKDGCEIAVERLNAAGGVNGAKIELVVRDDKNSPEGAVTAFRELTGNGIKLFAQGTFTANLLGTLPLLEEADVTMIMVGASALALTHEAYNPRAFRLGFSSPMCFGGYGTLMAQKHPEIEKWATLRSDVTALADITNAFTRGLKAEAEKAGRKVEVLDPVLVPYGGADFRNQISNIIGSGAPGLFNVLQGADAISYYKQARTFGLDEKFKVLCDSANEFAIAKAMGANTPASLWSWTGWYPAANKGNPVSDEVHKAYIKLRGDEYPNWYIGVSHDSILTIANAVAKAGSLDAAKLIPTIETETPQGALGKIQFRKEDHGFAGDLTYIRFGRDDKNANGWSVFETAQLPGAEFLEKATPGSKLN